MKFNLFNLSLLALEADGTYTPFSGDAWLEAGKMTLLGMAMIFAVLATLWAVLAIFKLVFAGASEKAPKEKKSKKASPSEAPNDEIAAVIAASIRAIQEDEARNDAALVAVITAAVAAHRAAESPDGAVSDFRVVSFKRVGNTRGWNTRK